MTPKIQRTTYSNQGIVRTYARSTEDLQGLCLREIKERGTIPADAQNEIFSKGVLYFNSASLDREVAVRRDPPKPKQKSASTLSAAELEARRQVVADFKAEQHREQMASLEHQLTELTAEREKLERRLANKGKGLVHAIGRKCGFSMERPKEKPVEKRKSFIKLAGGVKTPFKKKPKGLPDESGLNKPVSKSSK